MKDELAGVFASLATHPCHSPIKETLLLLDRYSVHRVLGIGGTAVVLDALDTTLHRRVALKVWNPFLSSSYWWDKIDITKLDRDVKVWFRQEAKLLASINHPNLCTIYDFGISADGVPWLAMELVDGVPLRVRLNEWASGIQRHSIEIIESVLSQIATAIEMLHRRGFFQLDVKPENILINGNSVKMIDLASGLTKPRLPRDPKQARYGTPGYIAPELITSLKDDVIGPHSDVFSLGVTLLEMCCLYNPLASKSLSRIAYSALKIKEQDIFMDYSTAAFVPDFSSKIQQWGDLYSSEVEALDVAAVMRAAPVVVPERLVNLCRSMTALNPEDRPRNGSEVLREVLHVIADRRGFVSQTSGERRTMTHQTTILFLAADPTDGSRLRLGQELRDIQEKLQLAKMRDKFKLVQRLSTRPVDISQGILDEKPQIVHFSGHGSRDGSLCFEDELGKAIAVAPGTLAALFELVSSDVECVLLNACYSESQAKAIGRHIKYVIGMNRAIGDKAAVAFAVGFYQALGAGRSVDEAHGFGCAQIRLQGLPEHLTPVLIARG